MDEDERKKVLLGFLGIEAQMAVALPEVNNMKTLMSYLRKTFSSWRNDSSSSNSLLELHWLVNARIVELIQKATISDEWFFTMIKDRSVPSRLQDNFRQRAVEIFGEL